MSVTASANWSDSSLLRAPSPAATNALTSSPVLATSTNGTSARRASAAVIEERISHEPLYGSPGVPLGVKAMRTRS